MDVNVFWKHLQELLTKADGNGCEAEDLQGKDLLQEACRLATGNHNLTLTIEERAQVKLIAYPLLYGSSPSTAFSNLRKHQGA